MWLHHLELQLPIRSKHRKPEGRQSRRSLLEYLLVEGNKMIQFAKPFANHDVYTAYAPWRTRHAYVELHMQSNITILPMYNLPHHLTCPWSLLCWIIMLYCGEVRDGPIIRTDFMLVVVRIWGWVGRVFQSLLCKDCEIRPKYWTILYGLGV